MKLLNLSILISVVTATLMMINGCAKPKAKPVVKFNPPPVVKPKLPAGTVSVTGSAEALKRLTVGGPVEKVLSLSPDKKWLLMEIYKKNKNHVIQKMKLSNGLRILLTPESSSSRYGVWYPDQKSFVFATDRMGTYAIVQSIGINGGSGVRFITKSSLGNAIQPDVTSDGKHIIFSVNGNLAMVQPNGMNLIMFSSGYRPRFSPDNKKILFFQKVGDYRHLYIMDTNGQDMTQLTSEKANDYAANWSPDGKKIAFVSDRVGGHNHIFVMDKDGSNIVQLTNGDYDIHSLEWGKDGFIYFSADAGGNEDVWRLKPKF